jgi:hypothetical protein
MTLPQTTIRIRNRDRVTQNWHVDTVRANLEGPIRRTVGASGDPITMIVQKDEWPAGFDDHGDFEFKINTAQASNDLTLSGYLLKSKLPITFGNETDDPDGTPEPKQYRLVFENALRAQRDGYGNLIQEKTFNELDENGFVDTAGDDYKTIQELVEYALAATGLPYETAPAELNLGIDGNPIDSPGPMDWGNARPIYELEAILGRIGWTIVQLNDGTIAVRPLLRAGQPVTIPQAIEDVAEPYELISTPAARANKIVITSGTTRSVEITTLELSEFNWVVYDSVTNEWVDQDAGALATYQEGLKPGNADPEGARELGQLYRALRLDDDPKDNHLATKSRFINIPTNLDAGEFLPFAGSAGVVEARCAVKLPGDQLKNIPADDADPLVRLEGLRAIPGQGVFVLPTTAEFLRVDGLEAGRRSDVRELNSDDLAITFAHEANTGEYLVDYFAICFEWQEDGGVITVEPTDTAGLEEALADPFVVKVAAPFLRNVHTVHAGSGIRVTLNAEQINEVARQYAIAYLSSGSAQAGVIRLRGIVDINPGDLDGAVTSVLFDVYRNMTVITINQHEIPRSHFEKLQRVAGRSVTSGIGAIQLNRSSASLGDLRTTFVAEEKSGGGMQSSTPEGMASTRGRERSVSGVTGTIDAGPRPRAELATIPEMGSIYARITGSTADGDNRWIYDWEEVRFEGGEPVTTGASRKSSTHGTAYNTLEMLNTGTGVQGNGVDVANLNGDFAIQPISDRAVVRLDGPFKMDGSDCWFFQAVNAIDGVCE